MEKVINFGAIKANMNEAKANHAAKKEKKKEEKAAKKAERLAKKGEKKPISEKLKIGGPAFATGLGIGAGVMYAAVKFVASKDAPVIDDAPSELPFEQEIEVPETAETAEPMDM